nr:transposase [Aggregatibacter actinomycetemcomitans]
MQLIYRARHQLDGVKSPYTKPKIPKMKKMQIEVTETTDFSPQALKKLKREPALARAKIDYLKKLVELGSQERQQKKEKSPQS